MILTTQQAIVEAAIIVFNEDFSAPLEKVAERAGVTRRTLHRYFKDRSELMVSCEAEMQRTCQIANAIAYNASIDPLQRLENMFYAGLNCGIKSSFLTKIHSKNDHRHNLKNKNCSEYDSTVSLWNNHIKHLQENGIISRNLTICWITAFFNSVVSTTNSLPLTELTDRETIQKFAWYSFSKGIGL
jgi:AcrR family transcriptional regulator